MFPINGVVNKQKEGIWDIDGPVKHNEVVVKNAAVREKGAVSKERVLRPLIFKKEMAAGESYGNMLIYC